MNLQNSTDVNPFDIINSDAFQIKKLQEPDFRQVISDLKPLLKQDDETHQSGMGAQTTPGLMHGNYASDFLDHTPDWSKNFMELS